MIISTWHKASLGDADSSVFKWRTLPSSKGKQLPNSKNTFTKLKKSSSPEPLSHFQPNMAQSILGLRGFKFLQMKNQLFLIKFFLYSLNQRYDIIIFGSLCFLRWAMWPMGLLFIYCLMLFGVWDSRECFVDIWVSHFVIWCLRLTEVFCWCCRKQKEANIEDVIQWLAAAFWTLVVIELAVILRTLNNRQML